MPGLLPAAFLAVPLLVPVAGGVPRLAIEATCRAVAKADPASGAELCLRLERAALADLARRWTEFGAPLRTRCTQEATLGGYESYVELITCLELATGRFKRPEGAPPAPAPPAASRPKSNGAAATPIAPAPRPD